MLSVENLNVYYGAIHALHDISFHVDTGEIVTLIGANGAGKTSILQSISALIPRRSGAITFDGKDLSHIPAHRLISMGLTQVPEGRRVFATMTVMENLEMGAYTRRSRTETQHGVHAFSPPEGAHEAVCRHPVRRRAADAGHGPRADEPSKAADDG